MTRLPRPAGGWPLGIELTVALAAGALHALPFALTRLGWLQMACVAVLAWRVGAAGGPWRAALLGGAFSTAWLVGSVWWLFISMHRYGGLPAWMAALAVLALCAFLALYLAAALAAWVRWRPGRPAGDALLFAALWLLAELARGLVFTGFPWAAAGYAHVDGPLAGLAAWVGVYGIGAVSAGVAALVAGAVDAAGRARWAAMAAALLLWFAPLALPQRFTDPAGTLSVALIQGNVPQNEKFVTELQPEALGWALRQMVDARAQLVVAPETVIPLLPSQLPDGLWEQLRAAFADAGRAALIGVPLGDPATGYTNSAAGLSRESAALTGGHYRYDKHHLVPFGEFIPWGFRWFVAMMDIPLGDFNRGPPAAPSFETQGQRIGPNICYEDLFGEELAARFADPARAPTVLANLSNIAWFGDTVAISQHLQISRMRAIELQRPMIRATNTGATALIDHHGRVVRALAPHTRGVLEGEVEGRQGNTPYADWAGRLGLGPAIGLALAVVVAAAAWRRRRALAAA
ncbi:apolipoprotein N-acyltransferase [uncultured Methylibium sp.]|uniref:apolipoprotein N-acyltransferase n=1 Tax=uncultured Methylibium sp. TaxID=381093 RepID=UPI0025E73DF3|nr:apolipoprotein N-acyltransferase [uncultured Methylibium sp.]